MSDLAMDMVTGNGFLLIPGFIALFLALAGNLNRIGREEKTEGCRGVGKVEGGPRRYGRWW